MSIESDVRPVEPAGHSGNDHRTSDIVRAGVRGIGQTLVTAGYVLLLFVAYELWVTNIYAHAKQEAARHTLTQEWKAGHDPLKGVDRLKLPGGRQVVLPAGKGFANIYLPRLGKDYAYTVVEGTTDDDLSRGPGHYPGTAVPGQIGNFSMAGHRVSHGQPFLNIDQLRPGDPVVIQTEKNWYVYRVLGNTATGNLSAVNSQGVPGREIVSPSDFRVVAPVPDHAGARPTLAYLTMTTCHPKYSASHRMVLHAVIFRAVAASGTKTPRELGGTL